jgi:hypothetical protein
MRDILISEKTGEQIVNRKIREKKPFWVMTKGGKVYIESVVKDRNVRVTNKTWSEIKSGVEPKFVWLYNEFMSQIDKFVWDNQFSIGTIEFDGVRARINKDYYRKLETGSEFFSVDMNSCFWQMAYKLGYIDDLLFNRYMNDSSTKQSKRLCVSLLGRVSSKRYWMPEINQYNRIVCNEKYYKDIYENVRGLAYLHINNCIDLLEGKYYWSNIDCIAFDVEHYKLISDYFKNEGIRISVNYCKKLDDRTALNGNKIKVIERVKK